MSKKITQSGFEALALPFAVCRRLAEIGITTPTPIQEKAIPVGLQGRDLIGIAETGTGKTLAFGLPMLENLRQDEVGLVLAPTRELAQQILESLQRLGAHGALVVGGASMYRQTQELRRRPRLIVATPGRLIDHLNQGSVRLNRVAIAVLDEADRMLDMGFAPAIKRIFSHLPKERQTMLFSATMPASITDLAHQFLNDPARVEVSRSGQAAAQIEQQLIFVPFEDKSLLLKEVLDSHQGSVLVFARTRHGARKLAKHINREGHRAAEIHADRTLAQRREAIQGFKSGDYRVLVATDIAARGIDVKDIELVLNYDLPDSPEDYVHRIGRTGRAGASGRAISFALPDQRKSVREIEQIIGEKLPVRTHGNTPTHAVVEARPRPKPAPARRFKPRRGRA